MTRKSAKQCKARWYEWLDPAIKKTEWTREEDEKLLHLAKIFPTQWRTIAPIVGRTPPQCLERFNKLLAQGIHGEDYDPKSDPMRLRPGEIDPHPESKPARPDPEDMDEDEKEMLAEARARLANTRGKKAKRKAREKQLEEAKRLATLQKQRELRAAGIEVGKQYMSARAINPNEEVVLERAPAKGFFDTEEEKATSKALQNEFRPLSYQEMASGRRKRIEQHILKSGHGNKGAPSGSDANGARAIATDLEAKDASMPGHLRRGKLRLPAPQVSEQELGVIAKTWTSSAVDPTLAAGAGGDATRMLLGQYGQTPAVLPVARTARNVAAESGQDAILQQARLLHELQTQSTPLVGGIGANLSQTDFGGLAPTVRTAATPNPLAVMRATATPRVGGLGGGPSMSGATPAVGGSGAGATPLLGHGNGSMPPPPPKRDALGLNYDEERTRTREWEDGASVADVSVALRSLPAPKGRYDLALPEQPDADEEETRRAVDAGEVDQARRDAARRLAEQEAEARSGAVRLLLPRPLPDRVAAVGATDALVGLQLDRITREMLGAALASVVTEDEMAHPVERGVDGGKKSKKRKAIAAVLPREVSPSAILAARDMIRREAEAEGDIIVAEVDEMEAAWDERTPSSYTSTAGDADASSTFANLKAVVDREAKRAGKLEGKLNLRIAGLMKRHETLRSRWEALHATETRTELELNSLRGMQSQEELAAEARLARATERVEQLTAEERQWQGEYLELQRQLKAGTV